MVMALDPISSIIGIGKTVINKIWRDKASEGEIVALEQGFELEVLKEATKENSSFREFILAYEGAAKDMPKLIKYLRSLIRPAFTILVGYLDFVFFSSTTLDWGPDKIALLKAVNMIVLFFWFGERAVSNSGIVKLLKK